MKGLRTSEIECRQGRKEHKHHLLLDAKQGDGHEKRLWLDPASHMPAGWAL